MNRTDKERMRTDAARIRETLCSPQKDELIAQNFFSSALIQCERFFVYLSFRTEVGTGAIVEGLIGRGKTVCVPFVEGKTMRSVRLKPPLEKGAFGIMQPRGGQECTCQVALVPLLLADRQGNRIGYGGGYYDRYFKAHPDVVRIGVAYAGQIAESVPFGETDVPLDGFLTEEGVFSARRLLDSGAKRNIIEL